MLPQSYFPWTLIFKHKTKRKMWFSNGSPFRAKTSIIYIWPWSSKHPPRRSGSRRLWNADFQLWRWWLVHAGGKSGQILLLCSCSPVEPVLICCRCELLDSSPSLSWVMATTPQIKTSAEIKPLLLFFIHLDFFFPSRKRIFSVGTT